MKDDHQLASRGVEGRGPTTAIEVERLSVAFGGLRALTDVSTSVGAREVVAVIGPNGAGKTTLLNAICGLVPKTAGRVRHHGKDVTGVTPSKIVRGGLGRSFQDPPLIGLVSGAVALDGPTDHILESDEFKATMAGDTSLSDDPVGAARG